MDNKKDWLNFLKDKDNKSIIFRRYEVSAHMYYFHAFANEECKKDKELNALHFSIVESCVGMPEDVIDFEFIETVLKIKKSENILKIPYVFKNNQTEKTFVKNFLKQINKNDNIKVLWKFEPGFWSDLEYTKEIKKYDLDDLNLSIVKELNESKNESDINYLLDIVNKNWYYFKYIDTKYKNMLSEKTMLNYAQDYGLKYLSKTQKNNYNIIKEAFHSNKVHYEDIDSKWKTKEILKDLLNNKYIWNLTLNSKDIMNLEYLDLELLKDKELMQICMVNGNNLIKLKQMNSDWFFDKEFKKLALKSAPNYLIIQDCLDDKELVLDFIKSYNHNKSTYYSNIEWAEQTKRIDESLFKDKEVMTNYLSFKGLDSVNSYYYIVKNATEALPDYGIDDLIEFISMRSEVYKVLPEELKEKWELIYAFVSKNKGSNKDLPPKALEIMDTIFKTPEQKLSEINKVALNEKLNRTLNETLVQKDMVKRLKI